MYRNKEIIGIKESLQYGEKAVVMIYGTDRVVYDCREAADSDRLCSSDIDVAITYLQELKEDPRKPTLEHYCWGYEDYEISLVWTREENDEEYKQRQESENYYREERDKWRAKVEKDKKYHSELNRLKKKFGRDITG